MFYYLAMSTKEEVLKILESNSNRYISGEEMADALNVSRASIWKSVKALEDSGYENIEKQLIKIIPSLTARNRAEVLKYLELIQILQADKI